MSPPFNGLLFGADLLFIPMLVALYVAMSKDAVRRLIALQLMGAIVAVQLLLLSITFSTEEFADLAIALALLGGAGVFAYAHFLERWL
jgi:multisubunit Na+/H+ antiporter MnhF subunit